MLRRLLGIVLIVLGLAIAGLGVSSATVWRESDSVVATATPKGDGTLVVTDPGVLELVNSDVTVAAKVPGNQKVTLAIGRDVDVDGWVGIDHYTRVRGLQTWSVLATSPVVPEVPVPAQGQQAPALTPGADPAGNDMWVVQATGEGSATLRWDDRLGRWSLLAAGVGEGAVAPTIELTWPRTVTAPWLWPGVIGGTVLVLGGLALLLVHRRKHPAEVVDLDERAADAGAAPVAGASPAQEASAPAVAQAEPGPQEARPQEAPVSAVETGGVEAAPRAKHAATPDEAPLLSRRARRLAAAPDNEAPERDTGVTAAIAAERDAQTALRSDIAAPESDVNADLRSAGADRRQPDVTPSGAVPAGEPDGEHGSGSGSQAVAEPSRRSWFGSAFRRKKRDVPPSAPLAPAPSPRSAEPQSPAPGSSAAEFLATESRAAESQPAESQPAESQAVPATATGSVPRLTRRELREQEEARKAAEQTGITGRLRALTGAIPVVRPTNPAPQASDPEVAPTRASRSRAWRQVWGFDPEATDDHETEGGDR